MLGKKQWTNPHILRWARSRLNLALSEVAKESENLARRHFAPVTEQELKDWEAGKAEPELAQLETLAEIYACPVGYFFLESPPDEPIPVSFRGLAKPQEQLHSISQRTLRRFMDLVEWTVEILRSTEQPWPVAIRAAHVVSSTADAEVLALEYRKRFGWSPERQKQFEEKPREAFQWWRRTIESQGIFCFELQLDPNEIRGAALWREGYPFILVNHRDVESAQGRIFTLLHEFAHLITEPKDGVVCDFQGVRYAGNPEPFANRFASRILVTPDELRKRLRELRAERYQEEWPDSVLDKLRKPFCASRDVVAILLQELEYAPPDFYDRKRRAWANINKTPWGRGGTRPTLEEQKTQEIGYSLAKVLARSMTDPAFSWADASSILGMKVKKAEAFLKGVYEHT